MPYFRATFLKLVTHYIGNREYVNGILHDARGLTLSATRSIPRHCEKSRTHLAPEYEAGRRSNLHIQCYTKSRLPVFFMLHKYDEMKIEDPVKQDSAYARNGLSEINDSNERNGNNGI